MLRAPTGAGKTTRVPPAIVESGLAGDGLVIMLEPRRVAARAAARRMAIEHGSPLGDRFGYQVRFDRKAGPADARCSSSRPACCCGGCTTTRSSKASTCVVFDEFHERGLEADLALGMVKLIRENVRPELQARRDVRDDRSGAGVRVPRRLPGRGQRGAHLPGRGPLPRAAELTRPVS